MAGRVFISCGQANPNEKQLANKVKSWFKSKGYSPYVAIEARSIQDVNSGIINELRNSDFYVFINLKREIAKDKDNKPIYGYSLYTNQELAIAYFLKFPNAIFFQQSGLSREGISKYLLSNATTFNNNRELLKKIREAVKDKNWKPTYTRHLIPKNPKWSKEIRRHTDHVNNSYYHCKVLQIYIRNKRDDVASFNVVARLDHIEYNGRKRISPDRTLLKPTDQPYFKQVILPKDYCKFDLLLVQRGNPRNFYLLSMLDSNPRKAIIEKEGIYNLFYSVVAEGFPILNFVINIINRGDFNNIKVSLK